MANPAKIGSAWADDELDAIVADYFTMLTAELLGHSYVKTHPSALAPSTKSVPISHSPIRVHRRPSAVALQ
jgi:hypothetical protein